MVVSMIEPIPWCAICGDSYSSRRVCRRCRADEANKQWLEASEFELSYAIVTPRENTEPLEEYPTRKAVAIARSFTNPNLTLRNIAELHDTSLSYVQEILKRLSLCTSVGPQKMEGIGERSLSRTAWREYKDALSYRGVMIASPHPPRWFVDEELGFSIAEGPSLRWTCTSLEKQNWAALRTLGKDAPIRVTYPKDFDAKRVPRAKRRPVTRRRYSSTERALTLAQRVDRELTRVKEKLG